MFSVAFGELTAVHRSNERAGTSTSVLLNPISSRLHPRLKRIHEVKLPFKEMYGLSELRVTLFAITL